MREEWVRNLLTEARNILEKNVISENYHTLPKSSLERSCSYLLQAFSKSADNRFFEGFFRLTTTLFTWFARKTIKKTGLALEVESITNRMYSSLCEYLLKPQVEVPKDNLFGWCYTLIEHLLSLESHQHKREYKQRSRYGFEAPWPSVSDSWIRENNLTESERLEEKIIEILITGDANLTSLEIEILDLYYKDGLSIQMLAAKMGISADQAKNLLHTSRLKVLHELFKREGGRFFKDFREEERQ